MPELITHSLVGEKVADKFSGSEIGKLIERNKKEYILGCQGGDLFFFYNYGVLKNKKHIPEFGDRLHSENVTEFFKESIEYIKNHNDETLVAYFLGYIVHYAADKQIHPFVYKKSNNDSTKHHEIEFMMGKQFLIDTKGKQTCDFDMEEIFDFKLSDAILDFYIDIAKKLYKQELTKELIEKCKNDFCDFKIRTKNPSLQFALVSKLSKPILKFDPMALVYKDENNWEVFTQEEYADFVSNIVKALDYGKCTVSAAYEYIVEGGDVERYINCFDGTDFCGRKK